MEFICCKLSQCVTACSFPTFVPNELLRAATNTSQVDQMGSMTARCPPGSRRAAARSILGWYASYHCTGSRCLLDVGLSSKLAVKQIFVRSSLYLRFSIAHTLSRDRINLSRSSGSPLYALGFGASGLGFSRLRERSKAANNLSSEVFRDLEPLAPLSLLAESLSELSGSPAPWFLPPVGGGEESLLPLAPILIFRVPVFALSFPLPRLDPGICGGYVPSHRLWSFLSCSSPDSSSFSAKVLSCIFA